MGKHMTLLVLILWRMISVFTVQTAHVPDEYWQSLEVAHKLTFGYGYLTWEWFAGIRSYTYPFLISILYQILKILHLDFAEVLITMPRIFQAFLSGFADYRFYMWTNKNKIALYCLIFNWYWYYCATRTLINSVETAVTTIALSVFPWESKESTSFLWLVGFLCFSRPTAAVFWLPLCLYYLWTRETSRLIVVVKCFLIGTMVLVTSALIDILHYNRLIFTPWEFLKLNVISKISNFYGQHSPLWYFYSGLPVVIGLPCFILPIAAYKICKRSSYYKKQFILLISATWSLFIFSLLSHKEFRFILPLLPIFIHLVTSVSTFEVPRKYRKLILAVLLVSNLVPGLYFSLIHQKGSLNMMKVLRKSLPENDAKVDILFLTPCHSTPLYSYLHRNIRIKFLTCEPNLSETEGYLDEAERFFINPMDWLKEKYENEEVLPSHVIVFDNVVDKITLFLKNYNLMANVFYAHIIQGNYGNNLMMSKSTDELKERLDNLILHNLELMEEKVAATVEMEKCLRNAQIELAKAKLIRGKEAIGTTQIPIHTDNITSLFELESVMLDHDGKSIPQFDISLKQNSENIQNPLKWFGILVPQSLRSAQRYFQESIYQSVKVANIQSKLFAVLNEIEHIKKMRESSSN